MRAEVLHAAIDGTHYTRVHEAPKVDVQTWRGGRCLVVRRGTDGRRLSSHFYSRYVWVDQLWEVSDG
jgi:hypothetical protein